MRALFALKRAGALEQAIALAEREMPHWPQSPNFFFALGDLLLDWAIRNPEQAAQEILPVVEQAWLTCLEIGEQPSWEGSVRGRGSFLAAPTLPPSSTAKAPANCPRAGCSVRERLRRGAAPRHRPLADALG